MSRFAGLILCSLTVCLLSYHCIIHLRESAGKEQPTRTAFLTDVGKDIVILGKPARDIVVQVKALMQAPC